MGGPSDPDEPDGPVARWESLVPMACTMMQDIQEQTFHEYCIDENCQYEWDIERAEILFFREGKPIASADIQVVGSYSSKSGTWLWGWANDSVPRKARDELAAVRQYGEEQGFGKLTTPEWTTTDADEGHDLMCVAASILGASAVFSDQDGHLSLFFTLHSFRHGGQVDTGSGTKHERE